MTRVLLMTLALLLAGATARAGWLDDADRGLDAYRRGDYEQAIVHWTRVLLGRRQRLLQRRRVALVGRV